MKNKKCLKCGDDFKSRYCVTFCSQSCATSYRNLGSKHKEESKQKMRLAKLGKKLSPEHIANMSKALKGITKGRTLSKEWRDKISKAHLGKKLSEEHKRKVGEAHKGKTLSVEARRKLSLANTGKKHTEETKKKLSVLYDSLYRGILSKYENKRIDRIKEVLTGVSRSVETRKKMSLAATGSNNSAWKGGISPQNMLDRVSVKYKAWRLAVYRRDSFRCQVCGTNKRIHAHHKVKFADNKNLRYELSNGITLCYLCHKKVHAHLLVLTDMGSQPTSNQSGMPMSNMEQYTRGM